MKREKRTDGGGVKRIHVSDVIWQSLWGPCVLYLFIRSSISLPFHCRQV